MVPDIRVVITFISILLFMLSALSAAEEPGVNGMVIKIGAIYNLEGSQAPLDIPSSKGALLAGELFNQKDPERQVNITLKDGKSDPARIRANTIELIDSSSQVLIGLSDTDMLIPAAETAVAAHIPFLSSGATSPKLPDKTNGYLYLACFGDNAQAAVAAEYAVHNLTADTAAIYYNGSMNYTTLLADYFKTRFEELGGKITQYSAISSGTQGLSEAVENLSEQDHPDIIYLAVGPDDAPGAVRLIRESGIQLPICGGDSYDTKDLSLAANLSGGNVYYTTHAYFGGENQTPEVATFIGKYQEKYGVPPDAFAGLGYDAVNLVLRAIELEPGEGDIRNGFSLIDNYQGVTGVFSYTNSSPIPKKSVTLMCAGDVTPIKIGEFIPEKTPDP